MKITLSKSQWQMIGKKAGWIKKAQSDIRKRLVIFENGGFKAVVEKDVTGKYDTNKLSESTYGLRAAPEYEKEFEAKRLSDETELNTIAQKDINNFRKIFAKEISENDGVIEVNDINLVSAKNPVGAVVHRAFIVFRPNSSKYVIDENKKRLIESMGYVFERE